MKRRRFAYRCWGLALALLGAYGAARAEGLTYNTTESLPTGLWRLSSEPAPIARGVIAQASPPDNASMRQLKAWGYGREPLLKPIAAVPGDVVEIDAAGIRVNGALLPNTAQIERDGEGHRLPRMPAGRYRVAPGSVWLVSDYNPLSLDSRYYGPVPIANIGHRATPVWVHQGPPDAGD